MMDEHRFVSVSLVAIIGLISWLRCIHLHLTCDAKASYAVRAPTLIALMLGSLRKDHVVHFTGMLVQMLLSVVIPIAILFLLGKITSTVLKTTISFTLVFVFFLIIANRRVFR